jgi:5-methylthioribose kinase
MFSLNTYNFERSITLNRFKNEYFKMNEQDIIEYVKETTDIFNPDSKLTCVEIGDGNLNYIFKVLDKETKKSVVIKQAGPVARISDEFKVSPDRNRIESEALALYNKLFPELVPTFYKYDSIMNCCFMEDLSSYKIMRDALINRDYLVNFAEHITTYLANLIIKTSDVFMNHKDKKDLQGKFINPELCEITEDLVYTEPFFDCERNDIFKPTYEFAKKLLWEDKKLLLETAKLKFEFMTNSQCLVHGDLHTGSIMVTEKETKVIDPEFSFYGPAGYDLGCLLANMIFAYQNAEAEIVDHDEKIKYKNWIESASIQIWNLFEEKFKQVWNENAKEKVARYNGFNEYYLSNILKDSVGCAGLELCRRILGIAHVKDITSIENVEKRSIAEKVCLATGKEFILNRNTLKSAQDLFDIVKKFELAFK